MTLLSIPMPESTLLALREKATNFGMAVEDYVASLAERDLQSARRFSDPVFDPIREAFRDSQMTDNDLSLLIDQARKS